MARVVIIEDDPDILGLLVDEIEDAGHEVFSATDGTAGLALVARVRPDVICSDINMSGLTGLELKQQLDAQELCPQRTVFIFISANAADCDIADGLMVGAQHYFTKPIDFDRLISVIGDAAPDDAEATAG